MESWEWVEIHWESSRPGRDTCGSGGRAACTQEVPGSVPGLIERSGYRCYCRSRMAVRQPCEQIDREAHKRGDSEVGRCVISSVSPFIYQTFALLIQPSSLTPAATADTLLERNKPPCAFYISTLDCVFVVLFLSSKALAGELNLILSVIPGDSFAARPHINPIIKCSVNMQYPLFKRTVNQQH